MSESPLKQRILEHEGTLVELHATLTYFKQNETMKNLPANTRYGALLLLNIFGGQGRTDSQSESGARSDPSVARAKIGLSRSESIEPPTRGFSVATQAALGFIF